MAKTENNDKNKTGKGGVDSQNPPAPALTRLDYNRMMETIETGEISISIKEKVGLIMTGINQLLDAKSPDDMRKLFSVVVRDEADLTLVISNLIFSEKKVAHNAFNVIKTELSKLDDMRKGLLPLLSTNPHFHAIKASFGRKYIKNLIIRVDELGKFFLQGARFHSIGVFGSSHPGAQTWVSPMDRDSFIAMFNWWSSYHQSLPVDGSTLDPVVSLETISIRHISVDMPMADPQDYL